MEMVNANAGLMRSDPDVIMIGEIRYIELASPPLKPPLQVMASGPPSTSSALCFRHHPRLREMGVPLRISMKTTRTQRPDLPASGSGPVSR